MTEAAAPELDLVGTAEAMQILGVRDRSSVTRYIEKGRLVPAHRLPGRNGALLFHRADVEAIRDARDAETATA